MITILNNKKKKLQRELNLYDVYGLNLIDIDGKLCLTKDNLVDYVKDLTVIGNYLVNTNYYIKNISKLKEYRYLHSYTLTSNDVKSINSLLSYNKMIVSFNIIRVTKLEEWVAKQILAKKEVRFLRENPYYDIILLNEKDMFCVSEYSLKIIDDTKFVIRGFMEKIYIDNLDLSCVTNISYMFFELLNTKKIVLKNFNTSRVKVFKSLFENCRSLEEITINEIVTDSAVDFSNMFTNCESLKILDLNHFKTEQVSYYKNMFYNCTNLEHIKIDKWLPLDNRSK